MKRVLCLAIAMMMLTGLLLPAQAEGEPVTGTYNGLYYSIENGVATITGWDTELSGYVTIPQYIKDCPVMAIGSKAFWFCDSITGVTIPGTVLFIGERAFYDCDSLKYVEIANDMVDIGLSAFSSTGLEQIVLPEGLKTLPNGIFAHCYNLENVAIPSTVTIIGESAFYYCKGMTQITIPEGVFSIEKSAFAGCESLTQITIPQKVTKIPEGCFSSCKALTAVTMGDNVTEIGANAFYHCTALPTVELPQGVTVIGDSAFNGCKNLTALTIPDTVKTIGKAAFFDCDCLKRFAIPASVTSLGDWVVSGCNQLSEIWVSALNPNYMTDEYKVLYTADQTKLISAPGQLSGAYCLPEQTEVIGSLAFYESKVEQICMYDGVTTIGEQAFYRAESLEAIELSEALTYIGPKAFYFCKKLEAVTLPEQITVIEDHTFAYCSKLKDVQMKGSVTEMKDSAFFSCQSLEELPLPETVHTLGEHVFSNCKGLKKITVDASLTSISGHAFSDCDNLQEVVIGPNIAALEYGVFRYVNTAYKVIFTSDAPTFKDMVFEDGIVEAHYPLHSYGWTEEIMLDYGGSVTWVGDHSWYQVQVLQEPTCTEPGAVECICNVCRITEEMPLAPLGHSYEEGVCTRCAQWDPEARVSVGVLINAPADQIVLVELWSADGSEWLGMDNKMGGGEFTFSNLLPGEYLIKVSQSDCAPRTVPVSAMGQLQVTVPEVKLSRYGDVNGDGRINIMDVARIYACVKGSAALEGYGLECADLNRDGKVNILDTAMAYNQVKG